MGKVKSLYFQRLQPAEIEVLVDVIKWSCRNYERRQEPPESKREQEDFYGRR